MVLNTCSGSPPGEALPTNLHSNFANLAQALLVGGVRCVISSTARVEDSIAQEIFTSFYKYPVCAFCHELNMII